MTRTAKVLAVVAWGALLISAAAPAEAIVHTYDFSSYAVPTNNYSSHYYSCNYAFYYNQQIRFTGTGCWSGFCDVNGNWPHTDMVYSAGRKVANYWGYCSGYIFGLDWCAC